MNLYSTYESRDTLKSFSLFLTVKTISKLNVERSVKLEIYILKIIRRCLRPLNIAELGHFTLSFCRGRRRNVPRIIVHVHSYCFARKTFCLGTSPLPLPSWFSWTPRFPKKRYHLHPSSAGCQAEPHTHMWSKRKRMSSFSHWLSRLVVLLVDAYARRRRRSRATWWP